MKDENREREDRLRLQLERLQSNSTPWSELVQIKSNSPSTVLDETINYLVSNTYAKLSYLKPCANPFEEIRAVLAADSEMCRLRCSPPPVPNSLAMKKYPTISCSKPAWAA